MLSGRLSDRDACQIPSSSEQFAELLSSLKRKSTDFHFLSQISKNDFCTSYCVTDITNDENFLLIDFYDSASDLSEFLNVGYAASQCSSTFLMPLRGFYIQPKPVLITDHYPYGDLRNILFNYQDVEISPTHKVIIALCISYGMMKFHEKRFIHGNLNLSNIFLNNQKLPVICGFERVNTYPDSISDPRYVAPELLNHKEVDNKIDVYSFGYLLYELIENKVAFEQYNNNQILALVQADKRPQFTDKTPRNLAALIEQCWQQSPVNRPTFKFIYEEFAEGRVSIPGANLQTIQKMALNISQMRARQATLIRYDSKLSSNVEEFSISGKLKTKIIHKSIRINYNLAESPDSPMLVQYISTLFEKLPSSDYQSIYEVILSHFSTAPPNILHSLLGLIYKHAFEQKSFCEILIKNKFFGKLNFISPQSVNIIMDLFALLIENNLSEINFSMSSAFELFINIRTSESLSLLHRIIAKKYQEEFIYRLYLDYSDLFMNSDYVARFATAMSVAYDFDAFKSLTEDYDNVFLSGLSNSSRIVIKYSYYALLNHPPVNKCINASVVAAHLIDTEFYPFCIQILLLCDEMPYSSTIFQQLVVMTLSGINNAYTTLCKYLSTSVEHVKTAENILWISLMTDKQQVLKLLLITCQFNSSETILPMFPGILDFILNFSKEETPDIYIPFIKVLSCIQFPKNIVETPIVSQMYQEHLRSTLHSQDKELIIGGIKLLHMVCRITYLSIYPSLIPLLHFYLKPDFTIIYNIIPTLTEMSKYDGITESLKSQGVIQTLTSFSSYSQFKEPITKFLSSLE